MVPLFVCTLFLSSSLLFLVQPMIAKMVLPLLGGTPAVWNTCMVFFQAALLLGYLYVHAVTRLAASRPAGGPAHRPARGVAARAADRAGRARRAAGAAARRSSGSRACCCSAWACLSSSCRPAARCCSDGSRGPIGRALGIPYFLSVAGNLGSIAALLAYPAGLEPRLRLAEQSWLWAGCYAAFVLLMIVSVVFAYRTVCGQPAASDSTASDPQTEAASAYGKSFDGWRWPSSRRA